MAVRPTNTQTTALHRRNRRAAALRAFVPVVLAAALVAGCSAPLQRQTNADGTASDMTHQDRGNNDARRYESVFDDTANHADGFRCLSQPTDCRVRDLRTPWEARRYLMLDGTLSAPPIHGAPQ